MTTEADVQAIHELFQRYDETTNAGDEEGWMALLTDDIAWMVPEQAELGGKDAVRTRVDVFFDGFDMESITTLHEVQVADDWAFVRLDYDLRATPKAGGEAVAEKGKGIFVLERQADGSWKTSRAIWNTNGAPPGM